MSALLRLTDVAVKLGPAWAVEALTLEIAPGEVVALLGANGAGKTSVLRAALGLLTPAQGEVRLGGADPCTLSGRARALRAAYLPQQPRAAWPVAAEQLVALGRFAFGGAPQRLRAEDKIAVDDALERCALSDLRGRRMDELSGGERMRVHLARALAQQAPLLVLDEPTAGLDPAQALNVAEIFRAEAGEGKAVVFSTHDVGLAARFADRVVVLRQGRVVAHGAPSAVLTESVLSAAYGRAGRRIETPSGPAVLFD